MAQPDFAITLNTFHQGFSPTAHLDDYSFMGNNGQASTMEIIDILKKPGTLQQGPGLTTLTNGNDAGVVDELIQYIMDRSVNAGETYAMGESKLFKITPGTIVDDVDFPRTITGSVEGEGVIAMSGNLFYFYNKSSGGDIGTYDSYSTFDDDWGSTTDLALEKAPHPVAKKEDILAFGNGRYFGTYIEGLGTLDTQKLDFGPGTEVADVVFSNNAWYIAVNSGIDGDNRNMSQIYMYDGSALSNILTDEAGVGYQKIGFLYVKNGIIYVAYEDLSSDGYIIGYLNGRKLEPLRYFTGDLPTHKDKSLYKNTLLFPSGSDIYSCGATINSLAIQISKHAKGEYDTLGALAVPFGTPIIASTGSGNHDISKFDGYSTNASWSGVATETTKNFKRAQIDRIIVKTEPLGANARCDVRIVGNQGQVSSSWREVSGENKIRHDIRSIKLDTVSDFKAEVKWENGSTSQNCPIRKIKIFGHYVS